MNKAFELWTAFLITALMTASPHAATNTWDGDTDGDWNTGANWVGDSAPSPGDKLVFSGTSNTATTNDISAGFLVGGIVFTNTADGESFTLAGANGITLGGDIDTATTGGAITDTISLGMQLDGDRTILTGDDHDLTVSGIISQDGSPRTLTKLGLGILNLSGANTFGGLVIGNAAYDYDWNIVEIGVDPVGSVGNITSSALGTGTVTVAGGRITSDGATPRTILNNLVVNGGTGGGAMRLGDSTKNGKLTFDGGINLTGHRTVTTTSDVDFNGVVSGNWYISKNGGGTLTLNSANSNNGFRVAAGTLAVNHNSALTGSANQIRATGATLLLRNGITVGAPLRVDNNQNNKVLRMEGGGGVTAEYAGTISLFEAGNNNFDIRCNDGGSNFDPTQVFTVSGYITGNSFDVTENALDLYGDGVIELTNPTNDFQGNIRMRHNGICLRVIDDGALSSAKIVFDDTNSRLELPDGITVDNALELTDRNAHKHLKLAGTTGTAATFSGPINVLETGNGNFEVRLGGAGVNNDPTQVLTISGPITSTAGAGLEVLNDGILVLSCATNDITGNIRVSNNGSTLRLAHGGAVASSGANTIILATGNTWLELEDGVTVGTQSTLQVNDTGNHGLRLYDGVNGVAESATFGGNITIDETNADQSRFSVPDGEDTLTLTGVISDYAANAGAMRTRGDGTIVFNGSAPNTFSGDIRLGDGGASTWNGTGGNKHGFVVVHRDDALGTGSLDGRGAQLWAGTTGITVTNDIVFGGGRLGLGGINDFELSGDAAVAGTDIVGHYGLEGRTYTLSGDIDVTGTGTLKIEGSDGTDNGTLVLGGTITGAGGGNLEFDFTFQDGDVYLNGTNSYTGRTRLESGTLHIFQEENLGGNPAAPDNDALDLSGNEGVTIHVTDTFAIDDANRGIRVGNTAGDDVIEVDATKTLTIGSANVISDNGNAAYDLVKAGGGTLILQAANTYTLDTRIDAGTLALDNGGAIVDTAGIVISNTAGALLRLDASETIGSLSGGGAAGGNVNLQANTLTVDDASDTTYAGVISGSGGLLKKGGGTLTLPGVNTLTGTTTVNTGRLELTGSVAGNLTINDDGTLGAEGSSGGTLKLGSTTGAKIAVDGSNGSTAFSTLNLDVGTGTQTVILETEPTVPGIFNVINYSGSVTAGGPGNFLLQNAATYRTAAFADSGSAITLDIGMVSNTWVGTTDSIWEIAGLKANWQNGTDTVYRDGDIVVFDDTAANKTVTVTGANVVPNKVTFNNTAAGGAYTLGAAGTETITAENGVHFVGSGSADVSSVIAGATAVTVGGTGTNTLSGVNTFTGGTVIQSGATLKGGHNQAFGPQVAGTTVTVQNGGTLDINGNRNYKSYHPNTFMVSGAGVGGNGAIVNSGGAAGNAFGDEVTFAGNTTIGGTGNFDIDSTLRTSASDITISKVGGNTVYIRGNNASASISNVIINAGQLRIVDNNTALAGASITLNGGIFDTSGMATITNDVTLAGGKLRNPQDNTTDTYSGDIGVTADSSIDNDNGNRTIDVAGALTGTNRISVGNGRVRLSGDVSGYTGVFDLNEGGAWLDLVDGQDIVGDIEIDDAGGTKTLRLESGATNGTVSGNILLEENGDNNFDVRVVDTGATLTISGNIAGDGANDPGLDKMGSGTLILSGTNTYTAPTDILAGTLQIGDGGTSGTLAPGTVNLDGGTLVLNRADGVTHANDINFLSATNILRAMAGTNDITTANNQAIDIRNLTVWTADSGAVLNINNSTGANGDNLGCSGTITLRMEGVGNGSLERYIGEGGGDVTLVKNGAGTWTLERTYDGANGWINGGLIISNGTIAAGTNDCISYGTANRGDVTIESAGKLDLRGRDVRINGLLGNGTVDNSGAADGRLRVGFADVTSTFNGTMQNSGPGALALTKTGNGVLTLTSTNTHSGQTRVWSGTLKAGSTGAFSDSSAMSVAAGGTLMLDGNSVTVGSLVSEGAVSNGSATAATLTAGGDNTSTTFSGNMQDGAAGTLGYTKVGTGTNTLSSANGLTGTTAVDGGRLELTGSVGGALAVANGATLGGEGSAAGAVTLASGSKLAIDGSNGTTAFTASGGLDVSGGTVTVVLEAAPTVASTFTVIHHGGSFTGPIGNFVVQDAATYRNPTFTDTGTAITLTISSQSYAWNNAEGNGQWDVNTSTNWTSTDGKFYDGDAVTFTDTAAGTVTLADNVAPASVTYSNTVAYTVNSAGAETLTATGGIDVIDSGNVVVNSVVAGATPVTVGGTGFLRFNGANTLTGGITVESGATLRGGNSLALGDTGQATALTIEDGGTFDIRGNFNFESYGTGSILVKGAGVGGIGAIGNWSGANANEAFADEILLDGDTTFGGTRRFEIDGPLDTTVAVDLTDGVELANENANLVIRGNQSGAKIKQWTVGSGVLSFETDNAAKSSDADGLADLIVNSGTLQYWRGGAGSSTFANSITLNGGKLKTQSNNGSRYFTLSGGLAAVSNATVEASKRTTLSGTLAGAGNLTRTGGDLLILDYGLGDNTHTGAWSLNDNTTRTDTPYAFNVNNAVTVGNSGADTLNLNGNSQTIGSLAGSGKVDNTNVTAVTLTAGGNNSSTTFSGAIQETGGGAISLVKNGTGTNILSGANTYDGTTTVNAGGLRFNGDSSGVTGTVTVAASGILGGTGTLGGDMTVSGTLEPGSANVQSFVAGSLALNNGSTFAYEINSGGVNADLVVVTNLDLAGTVTLTMSDRDTTPVAVPDGTTFTLINYSGAWNSGLFTYDGSTLNDGDQFIAAGSYWQIDYDAATGGGNYGGDQVAGLFVNIQAIAGSDTWDGDIDGNWSVDNNWVDDTAPTTNSFLTFDGNVNTTTTNDIADGLMLSGIHFAATNSGDNFTLDGANGITLAGNIDVTLPADNYTVRDTIALDMDVSGTRVIYARANGSRVHALTISGAITGDRVRKLGGNVLTVSGANSHAGFEVDAGVLAVGHDDALGTDNTLDNTGATLEIMDGVTVNGPLTISNTGGNKVLRLEGGAANTGALAGTLTLNENAGNNFDVVVNASGGNFNFNQVLTISGLITGSGFAANENAIDLTTDGVLALSNPNNDFVGRIRLAHGGSTLRVVDDGALSSAIVVMNQGDTKVRLPNGVNVDNTLQLNNNGGRKQLRLMGMTGNSATWSGPINVNDVSPGDFELILGGDVAGTSNGTNNDPTQVLTISGKITAAANSGIEILGDGVVQLSNPTNDITERIWLNNAGSTLRILDGGALASSGTNYVDLEENATWLELADGVSVGTQSSLVIDDQGNAHGLRMYDAANGVAESATFAGNITTKDSAGWHAQLSVTDPEDTLTVTGVIGENAAGRQLTSAGDGTVVFNGSAANTFSRFRLGDGASSTWNGVDAGNKQGFVVVHRGDALGTGMIESRGGQLQAGTTGVNVPNAIEVDGGGLRLGGTNAFELSGAVKLDSGTGIGNYGLEGCTVTLSGNMNMNNKTLSINGSNGKDNGALVFSGDLTNSTLNLVINADFDDGDVTLSGANTYQGKTELWSGTLHIGQEANLGAVPAALDVDHFDTAGAVIHVTNTMAFSATRGVDINNGEPEFNVDASKTLTVNSPVKENTNGRLRKTGDGTMILAGTNVYDGTTTVDAGVLAVANGEAIMDTASLVVSNAAGVSFRLDDDETIATITGGGASGGNINLQANTLTLGDATDFEIASVVSGGGGLTKQGGGRLTLSAANTLTGATIVNSGRLDLAGSVGGALTVADGGTLGGEGSCAGVLTLGSAAGASIAIDGSNGTTAFTANGGLDSSAGMQTVVLEVPAPTGGTFTVINYSGTRTRNLPGAGDFQLQDAGSYNNPVFADTGSAITLTITAGDYTWDDWHANGLWDINTSSNWTSTSKKFYDGDRVTFTNMGAETVTVAANVEPASVTFSNTTGNTYTLNDNGGGETLTAGNGITVAESGDVTINCNVAGATPVTHSGTGELTLSVSNSFTGGITVESNATVKASNNRALGDTAQAAAMTIESGGTFNVGGNRNYKGYGAGSITVSGAGVGGNGAIINAGANANQAFDDEINLVGNVTLGGTTRFDIDNTITTTGSGITVTKVGGNQIVLAGNNDSASISNFVVNAGILQFENHDGGGNAHVTVNTGARLRGWIGPGGTRLVGNDVTLNGGQIQGVGNTTTAHYLGDVDIAADSRIDPNANVRTIELAGAITGSNRIDFGNGTNKLSGSTAGFTGRMNLADGNTRVLMDGNNHTVGSLASANANTSVRNLSGTAAALTVGADNTADADFTGVLENGTGSAALGLAKTGTGTQTLSGVNTHSGTTAVNGGTLLVNGDSSAATGDVSVAASGTLGGTGSIGGNVAVNGGTVAPGTSIESLLTGALDLQNGSTFAAELDSGAAVAVGADLLVVNGDLDLSGTVTLTVTDIADPSTTLPTNTVFTLVNYSGSWNSGLFTIGGATVGDGGKFLAGGYWCDIDYNAAAGGANYPGDQVAGSFVNIRLMGRPPTIFMLR